MAVDKRVLEQCISEAAGDDQEMVEFLRKRYETNDAAAAKFVAGFTRTSDYTQKTQELANQRKALEAQSGQFAELRKQLDQAEIEKSKILNELAGKRVTVAKASELMKMLQEKYGLDDNDLPGISDLIETRKAGAPVDSTPDLDTKLKTFGDDLMKRMESRLFDQITPELSGMAALPIVWNEIFREHQELVGKNLTFAEQQEILKEAKSSNRPLRDVWESKYEISGESGLRMKKRDEALQNKWKEDYEREQSTLRSKQALDVVANRSSADLGNGPNISTAFKTKFREFPTDPNQLPGQKQAGSGNTAGSSAGTGDGVPSLSVMPGQHVRQSGGDRGPRASERAAAKHIEKLTGGGYGRKPAA